MENWITVATFTYPTELAIVKSFLEAEEIEFNVKDELAIQADNFLSNAIGGVKLQVKPEDVERVKQIVIEFGYKPTEDFVPSPFWTKFDALTSTLPFIGRVKVEMRFFIISAFALLLLVTALFFELRPSTEERIVDTNWCLNYIEYGGKKYAPKTTGFSLSGIYNCDETLNIDARRSIRLPGFETDEISARWSFEEGRFEIYNASLLKDVFEGFYEVDLGSGTLILKSDKTIIYCTRAQFNGNYYLH